MSEDKPKVPKWVPIFVPTASILVVIGIFIGNFWQLRHWDDYCGRDYNLSKLSKAETSSAAAVACMVTEVMEAEKAKHPELAELDWRVKLYPTDQPVLHGIAATAEVQRDWWWSKPKWTVLATFYNSKKIEHWWQYEPHEVFGHLAYIHARKTRNQEHKETFYLPAENAVKKTLTSSVPISLAAQAN